MVIDSGARDQERGAARHAVAAGTRLAPGRLVAGRYRVLEVLAYGGMSVVHLALDVRLHRRVALKVMRAAPLDASRHERDQEGEALFGARFSHPALVTVYDSGTITIGAATAEFVVLEYAEGGDLRDRLFDAGAMSWQEVLQLAIDACDGLAQLHAAGFVHRDVKPANVLIVGRHGDGAPRVKLADFGLSSATRPAGVATYGTAAYVSPEQVRGAPGGPESDVYSLGLVLLEMLTGRTEFPGRVEESAFARLDRQPYVPIGVPEPLASTIRAMTETRADRRPTAAGVGRILRGARSASRGRAPDDEDAVERAAAVQRFGVLDWPPERAFDAAVALALHVSETEDACVVVPAPDGARLFALNGSRLPLRAASFESLVPSDARRAWSRSGCTDGAPLPTGTRFRAIAGAPLASTSGVVLGGLCIFDTREREFEPEVLLALEAVAALVVHDLELRFAARRAALAR